MRSSAWLSARDVATGWPAHTGLLVVGHGTTDAEGAGECREVGRMVADLVPELAVSMAFLELCDPSIDDGIARLAARGCREVVVAPLLLFAAGHARQDVPAAVRTAAARHGLAARQADVLGLHAGIVQCARARLAEAGVGATGHRRTIFVGRGASDPTIPGQLAALGRCVLNVDHEPPDGSAEDDRFGIGFVAAARPTLDEAIEAAAAGVDPMSIHGSTSADRDGRLIADATGRTVFVHPHLLFHGHVEEQVAARVEQARREHPSVDWRVSRRLGADPLVALAVIERARDAAMAR